MGKMKNGHVRCEECGKECLTSPCLECGYKKGIYS